MVIHEKHQLPCYSLVKTKKQYKKTPFLHNQQKTRQTLIKNNPLEPLWLHVLTGGFPLWKPAHYRHRVKLEAVGHGPEYLICLALHSLLAAISLLTAELTLPAPLVTSPPPQLCVWVWSPLDSLFTLQPVFTNPVPAKQLLPRRQPSFASTSLLLQSSQISANISFFKCACEHVEKQASERISYPDKQLCFSNGSSASQQMHTVQPWLSAAAAAAGVSRQQALAPTQPTLLFSGLSSERCCGGNHRNGVAQFCMIQLRIVQIGMCVGWGGAFLFLAWLPPSATSISSYLCLSLDLTLFHLPVASSSSPAFSGDCPCKCTRSISNSALTHPTDLSWYSREGGIVNHSPASEKCLNMVLTKDSASQTDGNYAAYGQ